MTWLNCPYRELLLQRYAQTVRTYHIAVRALAAEHAASFEAHLKEVDRLRQDAIQARQELDTHLGAHRCRYSVHTLN